MTNEIDTIVVGAGLAGLCCARELHRHGQRILVLDGANAVGGRIRTDTVDGFLCDRGFQVFLTGYPEAKRQLDYSELNLGQMSSGSLVFDGQSLLRFADPWREPRHAVASIKSAVGTLPDKLRIASLRRDAQRKSRQPLTNIVDRSTAEELRQRGFSESIIDRFLRPFLGGIFIDPSLQTSSRMLYFVFGMFANGYAALPAGGMQKIPEQLAASLPADSLRLNTRVSNITRESVTLENGDAIAAKHVVLATDAHAASTLVPSISPPSDGPTTTNVYFTASQDPIGEPTLVLNGSNRGRVNTVVNLAAAAPSYSPNGQPLFSVAILDECVETDDELAEIVQRELVAWFGEQTLDWTSLKRTTVRHALPDQSVGTGRPLGNTVIDGVTVCGDWRSFGSIHHAMVSGREAAATVLRSGS